MAGAQLYDVYEFGEFLMTGTRDEVERETGRTVPQIRNSYSGRYRLEPSEAAEGRRGKGLPMYWALREKLPDVPDRRLSELVSILVKHGVKTMEDLDGLDLEEAAGWRRFGPYYQRLVRKVTNVGRFHAGDIVLHDGKLRHVESSQGEPPRLRFSDGTECFDFECDRAAVRGCPLCGRAVFPSYNFRQPDGGAEEVEVQADCECGLTFRGGYASGANRFAEAWEMFDAKWQGGPRRARAIR